MGELVNKYIKSVVFEQQINIHMLISELFEHNIMEGPHDPHIFKAVFVMGPPGSGKNTVTNNFLSRYGFKQEDIDDVLHRYKKLKGSGDYKQAHPLVAKRRQLWTQNYLPIIFNTTGRRYDRIVELKQDLEDAGYDTMCVFVYVTEEEAWRRVNQRAQTSTVAQDAGRTVDQEYFKEAYQAIRDSAKQYKELFGENFIFYVNDQTLSGPESTQYQSAKSIRAINQFAKQPIQNPIGKWIEDELKKRHSRSAGYDF